MPLSHAVLTLLAPEPSHGYDSKIRFESAVGPQWGGLNIGHLYQILDRLVRDGHVTRSHVTQSDRPDKTLYRLTETGADELLEWAGAPWIRSSGFRDELFLKLFAATRLGAARPRRVRVRAAPGLPVGPGRADASAPRAGRPPGVTASSTQPSRTPGPTCRSSRAPRSAWPRLPRAARPWTPYGPWRPYGPRTRRPETAFPMTGDSARPVRAVRLAGDTDESRAGERPDTQARTPEGASPPREPLKAKDRAGRCPLESRSHGLAEGESPVKPG